MQLVLLAWVPESEPQLELELEPQLELELESGVGEE